MTAVLPWLARFLHVRRTELDRTLQVSGFAIVLGWAMYTAFNGAQAIFLTKSGPQAYPLFFIILALTIWPLVSLQGAMTRRLGVVRAFRLNLAINVVASLIVFAAYEIDESPVIAFAAYVVYSVAFELVMLLFWAFVTQHFNLLEGKRIFPVIAAGSSIGYILSGFTTTAIALFATEPLMFVWGGGCALAFFMASWLERRLYRPAFDDDAEQFFAEEHVARSSNGLQASIRAAFRYLTGSRLVLALILLALVLQVASRTGDYLVAVIFVNATHSDLQALTILIGNAWLASYVVQLVVSLVITPIALDKLGVKNSILALPLFTLIGFTALAISPVLVTSLFLFIVRNGIQTGLDDPAENVLGGALPAQIGPKLKFLMDNLVLPGGAVISGVSLVVVQRLLGGNLEVLAVIGMIVACLFILAALRVRGLYVGAIYERLRTHAISLADFQQALGAPTPEQIGELQEFIRTGDDKAREFAAAALGKLSPDSFASMVPELIVSDDAFVRRLALQLAPPPAISADQLGKSAFDPDPWVRAAAVVAGSAKQPPWEGASAVMDRLWDSPDAQHRAAAVWAASFAHDEARVATAMSDAEPRVRLEAIRSFAKMKGTVTGSASSLIACLRDANWEVRHAALAEAVRWVPPRELEADFVGALVDGLSSGDREVRRLAAAALAAQPPSALDKALPLLEGRGDATAATIEALIRSGRPDLFDHARSHLEKQMSDGVHLARLRAQLAAARHHSGDGSAQHTYLHIALHDYVQFVADNGLAAMRALHGKRGFATVERGVLSDEPGAKAEGLETLLNFGPGWLAAPLAQLLDRESFDATTTRGLSNSELEALQKHPDRWVQEGAKAVAAGPGPGMKELIALKQVPLFSDLTLEQLSSIDRLMVTRHYMKGEMVFREGDVGSELYVVIDGEIRIHLDGAGRDVTLARLGPNTVVGEMSVFDDQPRSASAEATQDTTVRVLRRDRLQVIVHEHPEMLLQFVKNLSLRIREMDARLESQEPSTPAPTTSTV
ncbi:MAG TPA: cyclic nucleotide-binding domain-containing protein [Candidatus Dormibacteraeota bacterium]